MSFTSQVKNEISLLEVDNSSKLAELAAIVRNIGYFDNDKIELTIENNKVAKRIYVLLKETYNINPIVEEKANVFNRGRLYILKINEKVKTILMDLSIIDEYNIKTPHSSEYLIDSDEECRAYLRGVFLAVGSINDPKTSRYHLEFFINNREEAEFISDLLNNYYLNSKVILKDKKYMVYVKEAEKIGDFLRLIKANQAVLYYEDIRIYRDHKNMTNRLNNMEQANIEKIINTCNEQIRQINIILDNGGKDLLDEKTIEAMDYRLKYPESSLLELSEIISLETGKEITKSGLNHRFRKIKDLATKIENIDK